MSLYQKNGQNFGWGPGVATLNPKKAALLKKYAVGKVLDVACGSGIYSNYLSELGHDVVGVDSEVEFVRKAKKNYQGLDMRVASAEKLPFGENSFETVVLFDILEHVDDVKVLKEALRVGKRVIISVPRENQDVLRAYGLSHAHYLDRTHLRTYTLETLKKLVKKQKILLLEEGLPLSISGLLIKQLSGGNWWKMLGLKMILKPFLPEPQIYSTILGVIEKEDL